MTAANVYAQQQSQYNTYTYDEDDSAQRTSPTASMDRYPLPSTSTESTSIDIATGDTKSHRGSSSTQTREECASTRKAAKLEITEKVKTHSSRVKPAPQSQSLKTPTPEPDEEHDEYSRGTWKRN
ncbi:Transcription factor atf21 [Fusarium austroafricanum]|uniref:Transcription factor atf21 n=1 Tax=Fusarium austroafricanum TaxID=2364996 RepID=A0A8H4NUS2_9HYPO|nr:Transcription factor atf21 [Fusarium austroafricanum]